MIYTELTKKAMKTAYTAHKEQLDKSGMPYIFHPVHVAEQMKDENTTCIALLHDVVEDTDMTLEQLEDLGFGEEIITALRLLTHDKSVSYMDYIREIKKNPLARAVKIEDLKHNSDITRLDEIDELAESRAKKYETALALLTADTL